VALAKAHAKLEGFKTEAKAQAIEFVNQRLAAANAQAEKKVETMEQHSVQRIEMLKRLADLQILKGLALGE
jgi:hypothetical protein